MADILFAGKKHEDLFFELFKKMKTKDCYHGAAAYLLSLDPVIQDHINSVFDFSEDVIKPAALSAGWQTGTSMKTTRLLFNLWNSYMYDSEEDFDNDIVSKKYSIDEVFCCSYAPYYWQAIQLRYPEYSEP